jgi:hypothetical protein
MNRNDDSKREKQDVLIVKSWPQMAAPRFEISRDSA